MLRNECRGEACLARDLQVQGIHGDRHYDLLGHYLRSFIFFGAGQGKEQGRLSHSKRQRVEVNQFPSWLGKGRKAGRPFGKP